ncbi:MAG: NUMOD3 domain-containing DNA-binding protein [Methanoregula sp.]|jgi:hypothetical protein|nr:NUMOD3 domain-containing DNA-binding protein [Methanoregula sp.]
MVKKGGHLSEETKQKISIALKGHPVSEYVKKQVSESQKGRHPSPETLQKLSDSHKGQVRSEEARKRDSESKKGKTPKNLPELHALQKGRPKSEQARKNMSAGQKRRFAYVVKKFPLTPEERHEHLSQARKNHPSKFWQNKHMREDMKIKMCEIKIGGFWYGAVRYYDGKQYCEKFSDNLRERVRAYFGWICPICGTPQTGKRLSVHHVNYNKKSCCDPDAPRLFIPLCSGDCHLNTNRNREKWEKYFTEILMGYYQGKCYFTPDEMEALKPLNPF